MTDKRDTFPPELRARVNEVGQLCVLAGCTAEETIEACKRTVERWAREKRY